MAAGHRFLGEGIADRVLADYPHTPTKAGVDFLTPREREVLTLVVEGKLNKQAAAELGTVEKTIKVHRARVMTKMKARSLAELVRLVDRVGIRSAAHDR